MAYAASGLSNLASTSDFNLWHYTTTDAIAAVNTAGYFNDAVGMVGLNNLIIAVTSTGGTPALSLIYANSVTASAIDVTDGLTITATDSD